MGLMDKVKAQANQLAQQTRDAAQAGQAKIDQVQSGRKGDAMLRQLGMLVFADRTGRGTADGQAKIDQLISEITAHEQANGLNLAAEPAQPGFVPQNAQQQPNPFADPGAGSAPAGGTAPGAPPAGPGGFGSGPTFFPGSGSPDAAPGDGFPGAQ